MDVKKFDSLSKRDFENGAVLDEIRSSLKKNDEQAKTDVCFISEIINDLNKHTQVDSGFKFGDMLIDWQRELMKKAGFETIEEVREYHAKTVGGENW